MTDAASSAGSKPRRERFLIFHPERAQDLMQKHDLTFAEFGLFTMLSGYVNQEGQCYPSLDELASQAGMSSRGNIRRLLKSLRDKGVLDWEDGHTYSSHTYRLPNVFSFGKSSYQSRNSDSEGGRNRDSGGSRNYDLSRVATATPNKQQQEQNADQNKKDLNSTDQNLRMKGSISEIVTAYTLAQQQISPENAGFDLIKELQQKKLLESTLKTCGVDGLEAELIVQQFSREVIEAALRDAAERTITSNPGGYVRRLVELRGKKVLVYPPKKRAGGPAAQRSLFDQRADPKEAPVSREERKAHHMDRPWWNNKK